LRTGASTDMMIKDVDQAMRIANQWDIVVVVFFCEKSWNIGSISWG